MILKFIDYARSYGVYYSDVTAVKFEFEGHDKDCLCPECIRSKNHPQFGDYIYGTRNDKNYLEYLYCDTKDIGYDEGYGPGVKRIPLPINNYLIYLLNDDGKTIEKLYPIPFVLDDKEELNKLGPIYYNA